MLDFVRGKRRQAEEHLRFPQPRDRSAFTVIELVVVIAIIAVLSVLVVSAVSHTKNNAEGSYCRSNLRQWGMALSMYLADQKSYPLYTTVQIESNLVWKWHELLAPQMGAKWPQSHVNAKSLPTSVALCPTYGRVGGYSDQAVGSYGYNAAGATERGTGREMGLGGDTTPNEIPTAKTVRPVAEADVVVPGEMIAIGDSVLQTQDDPNWKFSGNLDLTPFQWGVWKGLGETPPTQFSSHADSSLAKMRVRHGGRWNIVFADGHVENLALKRLFNFRIENVVKRWNRDNLPHLDQVVIPSN